MKDQHPQVHCWGPPFSLTSSHTQTVMVGIMTTTNWTPITYQRIAKCLTQHHLSPFQKPSQQGWYLFFSLHVCLFEALKDQITSLPRCADRYTSYDFIQVYLMPYQDFVVHANIRLSVNYQNTCVLTPFKIPSTSAFLHSTFLLLSLSSVLIEYWLHCALILPGPCNICLCKRWKTYSIWRKTSLDACIYQQIPKFSSQKSIPKKTKQIKAGHGGVCL